MFVADNVTTDAWSCASLDRLVLGPQAVLEDEGKHHDEASHDACNAHVRKVALHFVFEVHEADFVGLSFGDVERVIEKC